MLPLACDLYPGTTVYNLGTGIGDKTSNIGQAASVLHYTMKALIGESRFECFWSLELH